MSPASNKLVYLISGSNKGIGLAIVKILVERPNVVVYAGARDVAGAKDLTALAATHENLRIVKLTSGNREDNEAVVAQIEREEGQLDIVLANAGLGGGFGPIAQVDPTIYRSLFEVNTLGPLVLFQASHALLLKSPSGHPQFSVTSSVAGSIGKTHASQPAAYGASKAAVNHIIRQIHAEHPSLVVLALHPGIVLTDMSEPAVDFIPGLREVISTTEESAKAMLEQIDGATRETKGGKFLNAIKGNKHWWDVEGDEIEW